MAHLTLPSILLYRINDLTQIAVTVKKWKFFTRSLQSRLHERSLTSGRLNKPLIFWPFLLMNKLTGYLLTGFAYVLYLISAATFLDYMYSLTIRDTVTAVENAFGTLVILVFMLVLAKFSLKDGKKRLQHDKADSENDDPESS